MEVEEPTQTTAERMAEHHNRRPDWKGVCGYCKKSLVGTVQELRDHTCEEYRESNGSAS